MEINPLDISTVPFVDHPLRVIAQEDAVENTLEMSEYDFRNNFRWREGLLNLDPTVETEWEETEKKYQKMYTGSFTSESLGDIKAKLSSVETADGPGKLFIIFHDPENDEDADIRGLMANPQFNGAAFQFASTMFGPLEGGKFKWESILSTMHRYAVQGEFASISTIGASLWRKYILPGVVEDQNPWIVTSGNRVFNRTLKMYSLENFGKRLKYHHDSKTGSFSIDRRDVKRYSVQPGDVELLKIPIHKDVCVLYGYGPGGRSDTSSIDIIPLRNNQRATCILSSSVDLKKYTDRDIKSQNIEELQVILLSSTYMGAIYGAILAGCKKIVLTMVGGGSFRNSGKIIFTVLLSVLKTIIPDYDVEIYLNYRYDYRRGYDVEKNYVPRLLEYALKTQKVRHEKSETKTIVRRYIQNKGGQPSKLHHISSVRSLTKRLHRLQGIDLKEPVHVTDFRTRFESASVDGGHETLFLGYFFSMERPIKPTHEVAVRVMKAIQKRYGRFELNDGTPVNKRSPELLTGRNWEMNYNELKEKVFKM